MTFPFKTAQVLVAEYNERDFDMILYFKAEQNFVAKDTEKGFNTTFLFMVTKYLVASTMKEIMTCFFYFYGGSKLCCGAL